jgi:uncharacterized hydrophobic protein (TIGR00271 family)
MDASTKNTGQPGMNVRLLKLIHYFRIGHEVEDHDLIHEVIQKDIIFKGTNLWILVFAIIVASVGLNMNSTAVIIGAMLISPLMGPINGMGYSIATYNFELFRKAVKNFTFAVIAGLVASTAYFAVSPISAAHSELLARTSPTIYDVLIALFGGLAGIIAISSRQKGNVIPGVAIATALMPPLCTAGYGLATAQFTFFFGALYLFTINTVFIGIAAIVVSQMLKFPIRTVVGDSQRVRVNRWISVIIVVTLVPSIYFGYGLVQKERFTDNATTFVKSISVFEGSYLLKSELNPNQKTIVLTFGGAGLTPEHKTEIRRRADEFKLKNAEITILQGFSFGDINAGDEVSALRSEISRLNVLVDNETAKTDSLEQRRLMGKQLLKEVKTLYPQVIGCAYSETYMFNDSLETSDKMAVVLFTVSKEGIQVENRNKIRQWLSVRLKTNRVRVYFAD